MPCAWSWAETGTASFVMPEVYRAVRCFRTGVTPSCEHHLLCELIGGPCSLATRRSRGCRPNLTAREVAPALIEEVKHLLGVIQPGGDEAAVQTAASRLAAIVRTESLDDRNLLAAVADEHPELVPALARLCRRRAER